MRQSTSKRGVHQAIECLYNHGVRDFICSPGSRNAPLVLAIRSFPEFNVRMVVDERSAAFVALGIAMKTGKAAAVCCTSGSAVANYYPAITEAFYQNIPLLALTADRPTDRIDQREGQSIRQSGIFSNHALAECSIPDNELSRDDLQELNNSLSKAHSIGGPVHWNFPLSEPLYGLSKYERAEEDEEDFSNSESAQVDWSPLLKDWSLSKKVLLIAGQYSNESRAGRVKEVLHAWLKQFPHAALFYESISNMSDVEGVAQIDRLVLSMNKEEQKDLMPDLVISFGGEWVTRKVKLWLKDNKSLIHWHIDEFAFPDILQTKMRGIALNPVEFFSLSIGLLGKGNNQDLSYSKAVNQASQLRTSREESNPKLFQWSDLRLFQILSERLPANIHLFNGNSSIIRYIQLFNWPSSIHHLGNRGVSGIDGVSSTSVGYAYAHDGQVVLISGDLAFFYDSNAFWQKDLPLNLKVIVVNNQGGGIFKIIEGPNKTDWLETHFEQKHSRTAKGLAEMYGLPYFRADNEANLNNMLEHWLSFKGLCILEVFTPSEKNDKILKNYFKALKHG